MSFRQVQLTEGEDGFAGVDHKDYRGFLLLYYSSSHGALIGEYFGRNMHALNNGYISITNYTKCIGFVFIVEANAVHQYYRNEKIPLHAMLHIDDKIRREP